MLLDGLSFFATSTTSSDEAEARKLLSNDLSLALETMRGRPSLRFLGLIDMKDVYVDHSGNVSVDVHPQALLSQIYFENVFCLNPLASTSQSSRGVKVSLGDTDGPETTQIVIYAQVAPGDNDRAIQLRVGRITTPPPPPSVKRLPRPDDPTPRVPPFQLNKHPRVRELKRAHTSADLGSGPAKKAKGDTFTVPALPTHKTMGGSSKGKVKARKSDEHEDEDVFGMLPSSNASTSKDSTLATRVDPEIEQGNKLLVKQTAIQYLTLGLSAPPPGSLLSDACGPCPSMAKTHERFKEILGYVYRGVLYALVYFRHPMPRFSCIELESTEKPVKDNSIGSAGHAKPDEAKNAHFGKHGTMKVDSSGLPLLPQPSSSPIDPLNYPQWLKYTILIQVSFLAFLATLNVAIINPAIVPLSEEFNIPHVTATYQTTVAIGSSALGPLVFTPFANVYGRRPAYLISVLVGLVTAIGSAKASTFRGLLAVRAVNGFGPSAALGLGAGTVVDLFFEHERGRAMGFYTLALANGAHLAPIAGGYVARSLGWRWCFWTGAILNGFMFIVCLFLMPETLFDRPPSDAPSSMPSSQASFTEETESKRAVRTTEDVPEEKHKHERFIPPPLSLKTYMNRLWFWDLERPPTRQIKRRDFVVKPLSMLRYPSVAFPALYYAVTYGFASIEPALTLATIFTKFYHFDTVRNGLANGLSLLIGGSLGELCSGPVTDYMMQRARRRAIQQGSEVPAEVRLQGIWTGAVLVPVGLLIFFRQIFGLTLGFYSIPFGEKIGYQWSFTVFALICILTCATLASGFNGPRIEGGRPLQSCPQTIIIITITRLYESSHQYGLPCVKYRRRCTINAGNDGKPFSTFPKIPGELMCGKISSKAPKLLRSKSEQTSESSVFEPTEEDEYFLTGYGDISLSNADYVPGLPSALSPKKDSSFRMKIKSRRNGRPPAPGGRRLKGRVPGGQYNFLPNAVEVERPEPWTEREDFVALVDSLKTQLVQGGTERRNRRITLWLDQCKAFKAEEHDIAGEGGGVGHHDRGQSKSPSPHGQGSNGDRSEKARRVSEESGGREDRRGDETGEGRKISMTTDDYAVVKGGPPLMRCAQLPRRPPIPTWN
ncbi:hypothetical protein ONZ45_g5803 [Pleurotus djamor]|nr:hypothetical protein ONZ45_g5803 [Pleurotus djamor]